MIFKPDLDENDFHIFNQSDISYNRHFDLIPHFPDMRSSLLYVKETDAKMEFRNGHRSYWY